MIYNVLFVVVVVLLLYFILRRIETFNQELDPKLYELKAILEPMFDPAITRTGILSCMNGRCIMDELSLFKGNKSYTFNKEDIYLCRDKNGKYYSNNVLIYVLLHELAHALNLVDTGHTDTFNAIFAALLIEAEERGIYDSSIPMVDDYCGHV